MSPMEREREEKHLAVWTILVILVLVIQLWTVMEISSMKRAMINVESITAIREAVCPMLDTTAS